MAWLTLADIKPPQQGDFSTLGDFILAYAVHGDLELAEAKFLSATPDPQYANPQAYLAAMIQNAFDLSKYSSLFAVPSPVKSGIAAAMSCFGYLAQLPVNAGDPATLSIMDAWQAGTGQLFGGHAPAPAPAGGTPATGQSAAPPGGVL